MLQRKTQMKNGNSTRAMSIEEDEDATFKVIRLSLLWGQLEVTKQNVCTPRNQGI